MPEKISVQAVNKQENKPKEILSEVSDLEEPIKRILKDILPNIERGDYQLIVGDDASGRIPTLIIDRFIKKVYKKMGFDTPQTIFFAGSRFLWGSYADIQKRIERDEDWFKGKWGELDEWERADIGSRKERDLKRAEQHPMSEKLKKMEEYLRTKNKNIEQTVENALIVTDSIISGNTIAPIVKTMNRLGVSVDLVVVGIIPPGWGGPSVATENLDKREKNLLGVRHLSIATEGFPKVFNRSDIAGVNKEEKELFARPIKKKYLHEKDEIQEKIKQSREAAFVVADHLIDWYEAQKHNEK